MPAKRTLKQSVSTPTAADSPFFDFLEKGRVPSLQERKTIREILADKMSHLASLNSKVPKRRTGKKIPRQLRAELDHTRRFIKFHQALIAPWRRLPIELIAEIFRFTLEVTNQDDNADDYWNDDRPSTLRLCRICRTWRAIAVSTPALWNVLSISLHSVSHPIEWISTWLDRSRSFPLYLQLFWGNKSLPEVINPVLSIFETHLYHTAGLWIDGLDVEDPDLVTNAYPKGTFPPTQSLHAPLLTTVGSDLPPDSKWDWISTACRASPRLTRLTVSKFSIDWFPITNLTKMHIIDPVSMSDVLQILEHAPSLQDISFDVGGPATTCSSGKVLVMAAVSRLEITSTDHLGDFLEQIELPALKEIGIHQIANWPDAAFRSFISRSSCILKILEFYDVEISENQIIGCLQDKVCNMLEGLVVSECDPPALGLLQHLTYRQHPFPNPHLTSIVLANLQAPDGFLAALVESRMSPPVTELPANAPTPARLARMRFSFIEGPGSVTHINDWSQLQDLYKAYPELELIWPEDLTVYSTLV
ncbi:hypothetical protein DFH07DRAFT_336872 [Mycena maculata]|uniref:F-box domain-containing protein n=1 Tax=Mycena maculata TaxID=230809 RepID=A0AAD7MHR9_9AGAR|nr:hypothetical protein DFH07DRAFT_336872 [Mycena maculata]